MEQEGLARDSMRERACQVAPTGVQVTGTGVQFRRPVQVSGPSVRSKCLGDPGGQSGRGPCRRVGGPSMGRGVPIGPLADAWRSRMAGGR